MKLKEKLARENCKDNLDINRNCMLCYLAGFEKAKELIIEEFSHTTSFQKAVSLIGEEEVK